MATTKYKIKGNDKIPNYNSEVEVEVDDGYEAYSKAIPDPTRYKDGVITWFNAFGVREKTSHKDANVTYEVILHALPAGKKLFALYVSKPHEIAIQKRQRQGQVHARRRRSTSWTILGQSIFVPGLLIASRHGTFSTHSARRFIG
jgi:hypothetical protein